MSSILEALEKLERDRPEGAPAGAPPRMPPTPPPPKRRGPLVIAVSLAALGAALTAMILRSPFPANLAHPPEPAVDVARQAEPVAVQGAPPEPSAPTAAAASAPAPPTATAAAPPAPAVEAAPAAGAPVAAPPPPAPAVPAAATPPQQGVAGAALAAAPPVPPPSDAASRPWGKPVEPPAPVVRVPPVPPLPATAAARPRDTAAPPIRRAPAGAPKVQLSFLLFSGSAERRSVALTIDGGGLETLHEGEESGGLEVVRILPDRVDLRWQGEPFTVRARD